MLCEDRAAHWEFCEGVGRQLALYEYGEVHCALGESTGQHGEPSEGVGTRWGFRDVVGPMQPFRLGAGTQCGFRDGVGTMQPFRVGAGTRWGFRDDVGPLQPFHGGVGTQYALCEDS